MNVVTLWGVLARPAELRELHSRDRLLTLEVTVPGPDGRGETVPVSWFGAPPGAADLDVGEEVVVVGRVRRRFFKAGGATQSRTDVVAERVIPARRRQHARRALAEAAARIGEG